MVYIFEGILFSLKEIARHIRPRTLRALYGKDKVKNAVHCTDLAEDATLEVKVLFFCCILNLSWF
jgi:nucleoside diphosphate kinase